MLDQFKIDVTVVYAVNKTYMNIDKLNNENNNRIPIITVIVGYVRNRY